MVRTCSGLWRTASNPPWILGCRVLTRPSIISGKPVRSDTSRTLRPASASARAVPPVEMSSMPKPSSRRANAINPVLSDTEMRAREIGRRCSTIDGLRRNLAHVAQSPVHTLGGARLAVNHDLRGATRTVLARQIDAFLNCYDVVVSVEVPNIPVRQQQHRAMTICQAGGASPGMKMEPNRKLVLCVRRQSSSGDRQENIFAIEPVAIRCKRHEALMNDSETFRISVMGRTQHHAPALIISRHRRVAGTVENRNAEHASDRGGIEKMTRRGVVERDGGVCRRRTRHLPPTLPPGGRHSTVHDDALQPA